MCAICSPKPPMSPIVPLLHSPLVLSTIHLIRHGEVHNPGHLVYADLPGFHLSRLGRREASATAAHLAAEPIDLIVSSPLERAVETATPLAEMLGLQVRIDDRLTEWGLLTRWAGTVWEDLGKRFPGEVDAYPPNSHSQPSHWRPSPPGSPP